MVMDNNSKQAELIEIAKSEKATAFFGDCYLINVEVVSKERFCAESGLGHLLDMDTTPLP